MYSRIIYYILMYRKMCKVCFREITDTAPIVI